MLASAIISGIGLGSMYGLIALGFHITIRILNGDDDLQVVGAAGASLSFRDQHPDVDAVRNALV